MNKQDKLLSLFSQEADDIIKDKHLDSHSYQIAGKLVHVIVISETKKAGELFAKTI